MQLHLYLLLREGGEHQSTASKHRQLQDYLSQRKAPVGADVAAQGQSPTSFVPAPQMSFIDDTHLQRFPLGSNSSVIMCMATKSSQSDKMQHSLHKPILLR